LILTQKELKKYLNYNPKTGVFLWKCSRGHRMKGDIAGCRATVGYWQIMLHKKYYLAHRLAWLYMTGSMPKHHIDHIDMDKLNNKISNLREATSKENAMNRTCAKNSKSGRKGVSWNKASGKWMVFIKLDGKNRNLGSFDDIEEAAAAYAKSAKKHYPEFHRL
jgi:hypothetical protein